MACVDSLTVEYNIMNHKRCVNGTINQHRPKEQSTFKHQMELTSKRKFKERHRNWERKLSTSAMELGLGHGVGHGLRAPFPRHCATYARR
jgi:hypothetical protein